MQQEEAFCLASKSFFSSEYVILSKVCDVSFALVEAIPEFEPYF